MAFSLIQTGMMPPSLLSQEGVSEKQSRRILAERRSRAMTAAHLLVEVRVLQLLKVRQTNVSLETKVGATR